MSNLSNTSPLNLNTPSKTDARLEEQKDTLITGPTSLPTAPIDGSRGFINKFKNNFRIISLNIKEKVKKSTPSLIDPPINATAAMLNLYLNQWAKAGLEGENRQAVKKKILRFLSSSTSELHFLRGEPLPPLFHVQLIADKLRTLEIHEGSMAELPESIGQLHHLEHLRLMHCTQLTRLPAAIGNLHALQTLQIHHCQQLHSLPQEIEHLTQLRSLILIGCTALKGLTESLGKLLMLSFLELNGCTQLQALPRTFGNLKNLEHLTIKSCTQLTSLPAFDAITKLSHLDIQACPKLKELPSSLYSLALKRPPHFLPDPWNNAITRMHDSTYALELSREEADLRIRIHRDTTVPFAQEHLQLLVDAMSQRVPTTSLVTYKGEEGADGGGLSREFWSHLIVNIAQQTEHDHRPILTDSGEGYYQLKQNGPLTAQHLALCHNIGKLLSALLCGLAQNGYKMGHVFPQHFYTGLLVILRLYVSPLHSFETMAITQQKQLCYHIARGVKDGLFSKLPFPLKEQLSKSDQMAPQLLHHIWQILNMNMEEDALEATFPTMKAFIGQLSIENLTDFAIQFRQSLNPDNSSLIEQVLLDAAYESYSQEAAPLIAVAQGFNSRSGPTIAKLEHVLRSFGGSQLQESQQLIDLVEGVFTPEAFINYMDDSINHFLQQRHPRPPPPTLANQLRWLNEWCHDPATTPDQMQAFLRFVHAAPTIPMQCIQFKNIRSNPKDFRTQQIRVHTCLTSLDLPECMGQAKETFIMALESVISTPNEDRFNMS